MNIKEVAKRANVSTATVSRTINNTSFVDPKTAKKVWKAIDELGYHPNTHARSLASGRSRILGLIVSDIVNPFFPELVKSFEDVVTQHGYEILIANTDYCATRMALCVKRMVERQVDGVAIMTSEMDGASIEALAHKSIPMVFLDVGTVGHLVSNINIDYAQGIDEAVRHLLGLGHRRIGFISGPNNLKSARIRRSAFIECLDKYGLVENEQLIFAGNHKFDGGLAAMHHLLTAERPPTAVLASNDLTAFGAIRAIRLAGLRVPDDVSVVGFDDIDPAHFAEPPLTTVRLSRSDLAEKAFHALMYSVNISTPAGREFVVETHLVVRESTGSVPLDE
ncbi:MAG: LacI family DNA-binding transcriptional regulator [Pyrinomonadaceae bacterium]|nr:LacI family DNA-binding transcriptional regulator [Pyrinomonadaceae bacterium]